MKQDGKYIALVLGLFVVLVLALVLQPKKISWDHTYSKSKKDPFASRALYELFGYDVFPDQKVSASYVPLNEFRQGLGEGAKPCNYLMVQDYIYLSETGVESLLQLAEEGHHILLASEAIDGKLADTLGLSIQQEAPEVNLNGDFQFQTDTIRLNFKDTVLYSSRGYSMRPDENRSFVKINDGVEGFRELSVNSKGKPVFVSKNFGKGAIYIHSVPLAFTNYYTVYFGNHEYVSSCLSFMPVASVVWDEYYKVGRLESQSPIRVILTNPALKLAYILALVLIALYMLFQSKRRQRIIPVIKPFENSTLQFVGTVARLFYNKGDHSLLAKKKWLYTNEKIRLKYHMPVEYTDAGIEALSARSGVDRETTRRMVRSMEHIGRTAHITEIDMIQFNTFIENFWKKANHIYSKPKS